MQLIVKGRLEDQLTEVLGKLRPKGSDNPPIMVFLDPKCTRNLSDYRSVPIAEPQLYKVLSKVFFENGAMQNRDVLVLMDGRSARNGNNIRSFISEGKKAKVLGSRGGVQLRLFYTNKEFGLAGDNTVRLRKSKTVFHACLPDPLETVNVVGRSEYYSGLPSRQRKWIDVPGTNASRGWSGLPLRSEVYNTVSPETKKLVCGENEKHALEATTEGLESDVAEEVLEENAKLVLFPWECIEQVYAELLHCFASGDVDDEVRSTVLDLTPGSGMLCTAATRAGLHYVGLTNSLLHSQLIEETAPCHNYYTPGVLTSCCLSLKFPRTLPRWSWPR